MNTYNFDSKNYFRFRQIPPSSRYYYTMKTVDKRRGIKFVLAKSSSQYMPYKIIKKSNGKYEVFNIDKKEIKAKNTTLKKAKAQIKLLEYIDAKKHKSP